LKKLSPEENLSPATSVAEYYFTGSSSNHVDKIQIPMLVVQAKNDPIINFNCMPLNKLVANSNVIVAVTEKGGHF